MSEINRLKRQAKTLYRNIGDQENAVDCGSGLLTHISVGYSKDRAEFDKVMARLREIDPTAPRAAGD